MKNVLSNIAWLTADKIVRLGSGVFVSIWFARYIGPELFGKFNIALALVGLFGPLAGLGLQSIVVRELVTKESERNELLGTTSALLVCSGTLAFMIAVLTTYILYPNDLDFLALTSVLAATLALKASDSAAFWFEAQINSKSILIAQNTVLFTFTIVKAFLILKKAPLILFAWSFFVEALLTSLFVTLSLNRFGIRIRSLRVSIKKAKELLNSSWPMILSGFAILIYMKIDQIMLGKMTNESTVGLYSAALRLSETWYFIPTAITSSVFPLLLKEHFKLEEIFDNKLQHLFNLLTLIATAIAILTSITSRDILSTVFGNNFSGANSVLLIHIWTAPFVFLGVAGSSWYVARHLQSYLLVSTCIGATINIILNLILIPRHGGMGAAMATVASQIFSSLIFDCTHIEGRKIFLMKLRSFLPAQQFASCRNLFRNVLPEIKRS